MTADLVVVGAGVVGAASAYFASLAGVRVVVVDRGAIAGGTSSAGEGNLLVSDKEAGPELDLALYSQRVWREELAEHAHLWEFEAKGGLVVAASEQSVASLRALAVQQRQGGVEVRDVTRTELRDYEPHLSPELVGGAFYPQDAQVQPMLVAAHLLRLARERGAQVRTRTEVTGFLRDGTRVTGVRTTDGDIPAGAVLNASGTWAGDLADLAGVRVPVLPRRGFVLVTQPMPPRTIRHKVYAAEYVGDVASSDAALQTSPVVEGTAGGTILIGASRERVGFDRTVSGTAIGTLAAKAIALFPILREVRAMRTYLGFRPYCPDHLPVIGPDPRAPDLWHACGHEGAGVGLSAGTGRLIAQAFVGERPDLDLTPFAPDRFGDAEEVLR
ncbi:FAD-binding oxidoreductase [Micromonospora sp. DR5-3]|uniref:NAD(P)/FAD-dependent oxidoreductase n=1 Tax=unclassified Micromonospora TaxID=2617518 RepID=UPI0011D7D5D9|nr:MULTISPECIES: FAD-binding oxidoreductase [unclassified Micromonospora]MCW3814319.1 FAD-binding oxidoreductase [Micromonospora sp. DR5-3]TYC23352.1 FAD-binding oxidoreductase [Micromonospora sp. MP36]